MMDISKLDQLLFIPKDSVLNIAIVVLLICACLATYRLLKGPTIFDRILSLDGIAIAIVSIIAILSIKWKSGYFLDLILVFSIFGFFGTVAFSAYLQKTFNPNNQDPEKPDTKPEKKSTKSKATTSTKESK